MSYVQGTIVKVIGEFRDPVTKVLADPPDVIATVYRPGLNEPESVRRFSNNSGVVKLEEGRYQTSVDSSPEPGEWSYTFESTGPDAVVQRGKLRIRPRPVVTV